MRALKKQAQDVDELLQNMTERFCNCCGYYCHRVTSSSRYYELKQCFDQNLEEIESVASEERRELLQKNGAEIQKLFDLFSKMEQGHVEERQKRVEQQQNDLAALRLHDAEDYTSLKVHFPAMKLHSLTIHEG